MHDKNAGRRLLAGHLANLYAGTIDVLTFDRNVGKLADYAGENGDRELELMADELCRQIFEGGSPTLILPEVGVAVSPDPGAVEELPEELAEFVEALEPVSGGQRTAGEIEARAQEDRETHRAAMAELATGSPELSEVERLQQEADAAFDLAQEASDRAAEAEVKAKEAELGVAAAAAAELAAAAAEDAERIAAGVPTEGAPLEAADDARCPMILPITGIRCALPFGHAGDHTTSAPPEGDLEELRSATEPETSH